MKISILSDFHFGYAYNSRLENDSFDQAEEAIEKSLDSDLILIGGDFFDVRAPKTQIWGRAVKILSKPLLKENTGIKLIECTKELKEISHRTLNHIPVIAIHGNHERLAKGEINAVEALENAGILIHLHCNTIVFEKDGIKVAVHGMSSVPERFAKDILDQWNPKPIPNCFNILFLHQNIDPYVYSPLEPPSLNLSNLPKGFNLIINGHIHTLTQEKFDNTILLIPGSTVITQFQPSEADKEKTIVKLNIEKDLKVDFISLETSRKFYYKEMKIENTMSLRDQIEQEISDIVYKRAFFKPPIIRLKIAGKETEVIDKELRLLETKYGEKAILSFSKELESPEITQKLEFLRNLREQKLSVEEIGLSLLKKNLDELTFEPQFDYNSLFGLLVDNEIDRAFNILVGEQKTLNQVFEKSAR
ncbi:MAG: DNA repair exonuclease [Candidatus Aenigmatarchaeota archaeon]